MKADTTPSNSIASSAFPKRDRPSIDYANIKAGDRLSGQLDAYPFKGVVVWRNVWCNSASDPPLWLVKDAPLWLVKFDAPLPNGKTFQLISSNDGYTIESHEPGNLQPAETFPIRFYSFSAQSMEMVNLNPAELRSVYCWHPSGEPARIDHWYAEAQHVRLWLPYPKVWDYVPIEQLGCLLTRGEYDHYIAPYPYHDQTDADKFQHYSHPEF